jgi:hypothetical protein
MRAFDKLVMPGLVPDIHVLLPPEKGRRGWPGHGRAEATPSFGRLCPATSVGNVGAVAGWSQAIPINTKSASIHTPFGLDGIFTAH